MFSEEYRIDTSEIIIIITPNINKIYLKLLKLKSSFDLIIINEAIKDNKGK